MRSDEQLVALFRAGSDDAFRAIHDRYRARLLAYTRQMLRGATGDAEDALQDVFLRAYRALRASNRPVTLRAWLYRIAHNRCIDELRRPCPMPSELAADAEPAFGTLSSSREPAAVAERSAALARLVADVRKLPSQQRSVLLMRELQGLSYEELAGALAISVPAVKSLLLRARTGLIDITVACDTPCLEIREELVAAANASARISGRARRHCADCQSCDAYRGELKRVRRGFAALTPNGPLGQLGLLFGIGGGGGAAASSSGGAAAVGGGGVAAAGGGALAGVTAAKIAVVVCCAALLTTAGRAVIGPSFPPATPSAAGRVSALSQPSRLVAATPAEVPAAANALPASPQPNAGANLAIGVTGSTGASGAIGAIGATGPSGATGATGASDGVTGSIGPSGLAGATTPNATSDTAVNGIGGAGTTLVNASGSAAQLGATGATGATASDGAADVHYDSARSSSLTGASGASGATATTAAAPASPAGS